MTLTRKQHLQTLPLLMLASLLGLILSAGLGASAESSPLASKPEARPKSGNLRAFLELARRDVRTEKAVIVAQNMDFTEAEAAEFWPLHRDYEAELTKLNDRKFELIRRCARTYTTLTDAEAEKLAQQIFDLEEKRTDLKRKYLDKFMEVIPATKAVRFFQIENQLNLALDLQVAAALPLIK